jgi:hypothetical protein
MTIEQMQRLSELTIAAVENNDVDTIKQIKTIIDQDIAENGIESAMGTEWFESLLTGEIHNIIFQ